MLRIFRKGSNKSLSDNFNSNEFDCKCYYGYCTITILETDIVFYLERLRSRLGIPLILTSGYRCLEHNHDIGGSEFSKHMLGMAADIMTPYSIDFDRFKRECSDIFRFTIPDNERKFVHCDVYIR